MTTAATHPAQPKSRKPRKTERQLRVKFTEAEMLEKGRKLAELHGESARVSTDFDTVKTQFKGKLERIDSQISETVGHIQSGWEYRGIACETRYDDPAPRVKTTYRLDNNELVETEPMTMGELQDELPLSGYVKGINSTGNITVGADKGGEGGHHDEGDKE